MQKPFQQLANLWTSTRRACREGLIILWTCLKRTPWVETSQWARHVQRQMIIWNRMPQDIAYFSSKPISYGPLALDALPFSPLTAPWCEVGSNEANDWRVLLLLASTSARHRRFIFLTTFYAVSGLQYRSWEHSRLINDSFAFLTPAVQVCESWFTYHLFDSFFTIMFHEQYGSLDVATHWPYLFNAHVHVSALFLAYTTVRNVVRLCDKDE